MVTNAGARLRTEREALRLTQEAFGGIGGVTKQAQIKYEKGERHPDSRYLAAIAAAGADVLYILTGTRDPATPALDQAEQVLLQSYRRCTAQARAHLIQTAALLSAGMPAGGTGAAQTQINHGSGAVQISGSRNRVTRK